MNSYVDISGAWRRAVPRVPGAWPCPTPGARGTETMPGLGTCSGPPWPRGKLRVVEGDVPPLRAGHIGACECAGSLRAPPRALLMHPQNPETWQVLGTESARVKCSLVLASPSPSPINPSSGLGTRRPGCAWAAGGGEGEGRYLPPPRFLAGSPLAYLPSPNVHTHALFFPAPLYTGGGSPVPGF